MNLPGTLSYASAALAFAMLTALLLVSWRGRAEGLKFVIASAASLLWAGVMAWDASRTEGLPALLVFTAEMMRDGAWLVALAGVASGVLPRLLAVSAQTLCVALVVAAWLLPSGSGLLIHAGIGVALLVLVLLEQIYRNASSAGRHAFKFLAVGLGGVYVYDLFLFSQAELFQSISKEFWLTRGVVNAALVPLIAVAARRNPQWSLDVFVSRQAVLFTTSVVAVGIYLVLMSLGGYYIREVGGSWGVVANLLFVCGALVVLAVVMLSGAVRRRVRVFVHKHFYRNKFDYRVEWLRFVATLSVADEPDVRKASLKAIAQVFESDGALLYVRGAQGGHFVPAAAWPSPLREVAGLEDVDDSHEFIRMLGDRNWVIDLREYAESPEFYQNLALPECLRALRGYRIIAPLLQQQQLIGFMVLREPPPPFALTYEDRDLLLTLGRHVALILTQQDAERRLAEGRQFEAYHRLTAFMMHDLKNLVAQLNLVVGNAAHHRNNPAFVDDAFATVANAASRMTQLIGQLSRKEASGEMERVEVQAAIEAAIRHCSDREPVPVLASLATDTASATVWAEKQRLSSVLEHTIRNAQEASSPADPLELRTEVTATQIRIEVRDQGSGMTPEFIRSRLFRPFDSTKGSKGMGVGAYQVLEYVRSLGGEVEVQSSPGIGTTFTIKLPRHD